MEAIHKDIRIQFTVGDRNYEALGFLNRGEISVNGDEMLARVPGAIGSEDWKFLEGRHKQFWSEELWPYCLVTNRRDPASPRGVSYFRWFGAVEGWYQRWLGLDSQWYGRCLVVRRCA